MSNQELFSPIITALIQVIAVVLIPTLGGLAADYLISLRKQAKMRMTVEQQEYVAALARRFIQAAEQYNLVEGLKGVGQVKKQWVIERIQQSIDAQGWKIPVDEISDVIEAEFMSLFGVKQLPEQTE